jgi:hypothetical protein
LSITHADNESYGHSNGNIHTDSYCNSYVHSNGHRNGNAYANSNRHGNCDRDSDSDCGAKVYADAQAASHASPTPISFSI